MLRNLFKSNVAKEVEQQERSDPAPGSGDGSSLSGKLSGVILQK